MVVEKATEGAESHGNHPEEGDGVCPRAATKGGGAFEASRLREITGAGESERTGTSNAETLETCLTRTILVT